MNINRPQALILKLYYIFSLSHILYLHILQQNNNKNIPCGQPQTNSQSIYQMTSQTKTIIQNHKQQKLEKYQKVQQFLCIDYQQIMVHQFIKLSKQLGIDQNNGFFFQTPQEYLKYFVQLVNWNMQKNQDLEAKNKRCQGQVKLIKSINHNLTQQNQNLKNKLQKQLQKCQQLQNNKLILQQKLTNTQKQLKDKQKNLIAQIFKLKQQLNKMQSQYDIKFLEQKKSIIQKANKDIAKFRADTEVQLTQKQKAMKIENDKRDRQLKALLTTINTLIQRKQGKQGEKYKQKYSRMTISTSKIMDSTPSTTDFVRKQSTSLIQEQQTQFAILSAAIKPFTQHTALQQKLTQCRRQINQLRTQLRQLNISLTNTISTLSQKQHQLNLLNSKYTQLNTKYEQNYDKLITLNEELIKCKEDKQNLDKYYAQRWNSEINKVLYNMQKKYIEKQTQLEQNFKMLGQKLQQQQYCIRHQIKITRQQNQKLTQRNKNLVYQNSTLTLQKQLYKNSVNQFNHKLQQIQIMHNEDLLSLKLRYIQRQRNLMRQIMSYKKQIYQNNIQKQQIIQQNIKQKIQIIRQCQNQMNKKIAQLQKIKQIEIIQKIEIINKIQNQLQVHKKLIKDLQRSQSQKMQQIRQKNIKQKQKSIRDFKVAQLQQTAKLNEKIIKFDEKLKFIKNQCDVKEKQCMEMLAKKQKIINQLRFELDQQKQKMVNYEEMINKFKKQIEKLVNFTSSSQLTIDSLKAQIKSNKLLLQMKVQSISILVKQKNTWKNDVEECRKQFEKGFKELKQIHQKKINNYRSRIWELERICESGGICKKDYQKMIKLNDQKKKLQDKLAMKQAENLIINQVKSYYENKTRQLDSKMMIGFQFKDQKKSVFIRKPKRDSRPVMHIKTQISEDLDGFICRQAIDVRNVLNTSRNKDRSHMQMKSLSNYEKKFQSRTNSRSNPRINSSLM